MILQTTHLPGRTGGGARDPLLPATLHRELEDQEATAWLTEPMIATDTDIAMTWTWRLGGEATETGTRGHGPGPRPSIHLVADGPRAAAGPGLRGEILSLQGSRGTPGKTRRRCGVSTARTATSPSTTGTA